MAPRDRTAPILKGQDDDGSFQVHQDEGAKIESTNDVDIARCRAAYGSTLT